MQICVFFSYRDDKKQTLNHGVNLKKKTARLTRQKVFLQSLNVKVDYNFYDSATIKLQILAKVSLKIKSYAHFMVSKVNF